VTYLSFGVCIVCNEAEILNTRGINFFVLPSTTETIIQKINISKCITIYSETNFPISSFHLSA